MSDYKYIIPSYVIPTVNKYQNVNLDENLQRSVSRKFREHTIFWMENDKSYKSVKKYLKDIKGPNGEMIIRKILNLFVVRGNTNWYDLELQITLVKQFILYKLKSI
jgi:hypothetical protein